MHSHTTSIYNMIYSFFLLESYRSVSSLLLGKNFFVAQTRVFDNNRKIKEKRRLWKIKMWFVTNLCKRLISFLLNVPTFLWLGTFLQLLLFESILNGNHFITTLLELGPIFPSCWVLCSWVPEFPSSQVLGFFVPEALNSQVLGFYVPKDPSCQFLGFYVPEAQSSQFLEFYVPEARTQQTVHIFCLVSTWEDPKWSGLVAAGQRTNRETWNRGQTVAVPTRPSQRQSEFQSLSFTKVEGA